MEINGQVLVELSVIDKDWISFQNWFDGFTFTFGDDVADEGNFFGVGWPRFDGEVVDFGRDLITVRLRQQHRNPAGSEWP